MSGHEAVETLRVAALALTCSVHLHVSAARLFIIDHEHPLSRGICWEKSLEDQ